MYYVCLMTKSRNQLFMSQFSVFITYHLVKSCTAISMCKTKCTIFAKEKKMVLKPVHLCQKNVLQTSVAKDLFEILEMKESTKD